MKKVVSLLVTLTPLFCYCQVGWGFDTSKLINGNGIAPLITNRGQESGFQTFKDYHPQGMYYYVDTSEDFAIKGILAFDPTCINYTSGFKIKYQIYTDTLKKTLSDTLILVIDSALFLELFKYSSAKIIDKEFAMVPPTVIELQPDLKIDFVDYAVVPIGRWEKIDLKENFIFTQYDFDDCGNALSVRYFNQDGSLINERKYKVRPKKKKYWYSNTEYEQD